MNSLVLLSYEEENSALQRELTRVELSDGHFLRYLEYDTNLFRGIDRYFTKSNSVSVKQKLLGSFFPHPVIYENEAVRTTRLCETVEVLCPEHGAFGGNKKGPETDFCLQPTWAPPNVEISKELEADVRNIYSLHELIKL